MKSNQLELLPKNKLTLVFGGRATKGKRKGARVILPKHWVHLCLKSKKAHGSCSLWQKGKRQKIEKLIRTKAKQHNVQLKDAVNMGNHLHVKIKVTRHADFKAFLRSIAGHIARIATGARKGKKFGKFWDGLAFTRVLKTKFEELQLKGYFEANRIERQYGYQARLRALKEFNAWLYQLRRSSEAY